MRVSEGSCSPSAHQFAFGKSALPDFLRALRLENLFVTLEGINNFFSHSPDFLRALRQHIPVECVPVLFTDLHSPDFLGHWFL